MLVILIKCLRLIIFLIYNVYFYIPPPVCHPLDLPPGAAAPLAADCACEVHNNRCEVIQLPDKLNLAGR
jgi:hypothetical protein